MITKKQLIQWREELDKQRQVLIDELTLRINSEDPSDYGLQLSRIELVGEIRVLDCQSIMLGEIIRGKRL